MQIAQGPQPVQQGFNGIPVTRDDYLLLTYYIINSFVNITVYVNFMYPDGSIQLMRFPSTGSDISYVNTDTFRLTNGFILSVSCKGDSAVGIFADTHVSLQLQKGSVAGETPYYTFFTGYLSEIVPLSWPAQNFIPLRSIPGVLSCHDLSHTAGDSSSTTYTLPTFVYAQLLSVNFKFDTDSNAGNRVVWLEISSCFNRNLRFYVPDSVTADSFLYPHFLVGIGNWNLNFSRHYIPLPFPFPLGPGSSFVINVNGAQAGDQLSDIMLYMEKWTAES